MKKILLIAAIGGLSLATYAEMDVKGVQVSGYLDMSASYTKSDTTDTSSAGLDTAELEFKSPLADGVSVAAYVTGHGNNDNSGLNTIDLEQAYVAYTAISNVTITAGKFLSSLGWEAYHAPDLFQWSTSAALVYPGMENGVSARYDFKKAGLSVYGAALSSAFDSNDKDPKSGAFEGSLKYTGIENFTLFAGTATEKKPGYQQTLVNLWASYAANGLTLAAEVDNLSDWGANGNKGYGGLLMGNYKFTDKVGLTLRTSGLYVEDDAGNAITEDAKFTISPSYALTDNVCLVSEFNTIKHDVTDVTENTGAVEAIITF